MSGGLVFAVLGAGRTGKTTLVQAMTHALAGRGLDAVMVPDGWHSFCDVQRRLPRQAELAVIARAQSQAIAEAAAKHALVLADSTALMPAVYSELACADAGLLPQAECDHAIVCATLLTSLDLAWVPGGMPHGEGPDLREPLDECLRRSLQRMARPFAVVAGQGDARLRHGLSLVEHHLNASDRAARAASQVRWRWLCARCDDGECERHGLG